MMRGLAVGFVALAVLMAAGAEPGAAQEVIKDPATIRSCLCERQRVASLRQKVRESRAHYDASRKALATLDRQLKTRRAGIDVYDNAQVDAYKRLLQRRDEASSAFAAALRDYDAAVKRYNPVVADYNSRCAGKSFDEAALRAVEKTLSCAKP